VLTQNENTALLGLTAPVQVDFRIETYVLPASSAPGAEMGAGSL
jgi:hypothetical protein